MSTRPRQRESRPSESRPRQSICSQGNREILIFGDLRDGQRAVGRLELVVVAADVVEEPRKLEHEIVAGAIRLVHLVPREAKTDVAQVVDDQVEPPLVGEQLLVWHGRTAAVDQ